MSFIRLKKRAFKNFEIHYAYLVNNKWKNYSSIQKVNEYLGRFYKINPININPKLNLPLKKEKILLYLLKRELLIHNFKQKNSFLYKHADGYIINLKTNKVFDKTKKQVCLGLNQGYLCSFTLKNLNNFNFKIKDKKKSGKLLIKTLLDAGININQELFLNIFDKTIK